MRPGRLSLQHMFSTSQALIGGTSGNASSTGTPRLHYDVDHSIAATCVEAQQLSEPATGYSWTSNPFLGLAGRAGSARVLQSDLHLGDRIRQARHRPSANA